jgi:hypothetical protein
MMYSRLKRRFEAVPADVIALQLSELRFPHAGRDGSEADRADSVECSVLVFSVREGGRFMIGHVSSQLHPLAAS